MPVVDGVGSTRLSGERLVLLGCLLGVLLVLLELTEGARTVFLPAGRADHAVDVALVVAVCVTVAIGSARMVARRSTGRSRVVSDAAAAEAFLRSATARVDAADAAVRLEGLRDLEFLGQAGPGHRQPVVDRWCAYLVTAPPGETDVRAAVQHLIARHLRTGDDPTAYWPEVRRVALEGARLWRLDLRGCVLPHVDLRGASFDEATRFDGARFTGEAAFDSADFAGDVSFAGATFGRDAAFYGARFRARADFDASAFECGAAFHASEFGGRASFRCTAFGRDVHFDEARFDGAPDLTGARAHRRSRLHLPAGWTLDDDGHEAGSRRFVVRR